MYDDVVSIRYNEDGTLKETDIETECEGCALNDCHPKMPNELNRWYEYCHGCYKSYIKEADERNTLPDKYISA